MSGEGAVNFQGNLIGSLIYDADGVVNVSDGKNIVVSSAPVAVTTATTDTATCPAPTGLTASMSLI